MSGFGLSSRLRLPAEPQTPSLKAQSVFSSPVKHAPEACFTLYIYPCIGGILIIMVEMSGLEPPTS
jgi:hypothetical protein